MTLNERFLKAKHWQLFLLMYGIPIIFYIVMMVKIFSTIDSGTSPDPMMMSNFFMFFPVLMIVFMWAFYCWYWAVAIGLQKKVPASVKMKTRKFKASFFIPLVYMVLIFAAIAFGMNTFPAMIERGEQPDFVLIGVAVAIMVPLHLLTIVCTFYSLYFVAKTIKTVELQRETTFSDFVGEFFLVWFYPIGIWILQPKINRMWEKDNAGSTDMMIDLIVDD
jgi:hypothetical protein